MRAPEEESGASRPWKNIRPLRGLPRAPYRSLSCYGRLPIGKGQAPGTATGRGATGVAACPRRTVFLRGADFLRAGPRLAARFLIRRLAGRRLPARFLIRRLAGLRLAGRFRTAFFFGFLLPDLLFAFGIRTSCLIAPSDAPTKGPRALCRRALVQGGLRFCCEIAIQAFRIEIDTAAPGYSV